MKLHVSRPPDRALSSIERLAGCSPCAKSKRAVVVYTPSPFQLWGSGFNSPPNPMRCDGSEACRRDCAKICIHAEQAAIRAAIEHLSVEYGPHNGSVLEGLDMLHAKVVNGAVVAGGPPSCWQCSREVLEQQLAGVWLFERPHGIGHGELLINGADVQVPVAIGRVAQGPDMGEHR